MERNAENKTDIIQTSQALNLKLKSLKPSRDMCEASLKQINLPVNS